MLRREYGFLKNLEKNIGSSKIAFPPEIQKLFKEYDQK
jgi:hypothetical protein